MDAAETDSDVKLQRVAGDLIRQFDAALGPLLRKKGRDGDLHMRDWVRVRDVSALTSNVLDPFLELPQLLDPHLPTWVPFLSAAYLECLLARHRQRRAAPTHASAFLMSADRAICQLLYTLCKVRGEKVIVRFLNNETRHLEPIISAIEEAGQPPTGSEPWSWNQRYIVLLWLSHLMLAPFDLSTISSAELDEETAPEIDGLQLPDGLPGVAIRAVCLGVKYLGTPGKEMDAAKLLLVRISMRRDMQQQGLLQSLVAWALSAFRPAKGGPAQTQYFYLGVLSYLAGVLRASSDTSDMDSHLPAIFTVVHRVSAAADDLSKAVVSLASARKVIIKVLRSIATLLLRKPSRDMKSTQLTETIIGYLLDSLADNDTPVRLAASKALGIITLKLEYDMASEVVDAVLGSLNRNVLWSKSSNASGGKPERDLSAVNSLEWHGLMLTLSHLLYRRSPPTEQLSDVIHALLLGLSFEQRSTSGGSVGANVRDAACFGIWALARRYSTAELLAVSTQSIFAAKAHSASHSVLQVLGTELVVTACLDPAGNIRRGASAALQELIGRHSDTVERGIDVVQTVDYHAVARRSRATEEVALGVSRLSSIYAEAIIDGIVGWRGVGDANTASRRVSGVAFGTIAAVMATGKAEGQRSRLDVSITLAADQLAGLQSRQVEERHGLLLCLANAVKNSPNFSGVGPAADRSLIRMILDLVSSILEQCSDATYRRPELVAEAASFLAVSMLPVLQAATINLDGPRNYVAGHHLLSPAMADALTGLASSADSAGGSCEQVGRFVAALAAVVPAWLDRNEEEVIESASLAALVLSIFSKPAERLRVLQDWAKAVRAKPASRTSSHGKGYFYALAMAQPLIERSGSRQVRADLVSSAFIDRWSVDVEIETRVSILKSMARGRLLQDKPLIYIGLVAEGLCDYTTNAQGDVGSHVRVQALRAVKSVWEGLEAMSDAAMEESVKAVFYSVLRLSAEKLDRVRPEAQEALATVMQPSFSVEFLELPFTSQKYLETLLQLRTAEHLRPRVSTVATARPDLWMTELMAGFVTSADTGNEDLVMASRAGLCSFCDASSANLSATCAALVGSLQTHQGQDRVVVPTLEVIGFLFHMGLFQQDSDVDLGGLCLQTQKAAYKTGNMRKLAACVKVYGGVAGMRSGREHEAAVRQAKRRLGALMFHPWPKVRSTVVDELWVLVGDEGKAKLLGVDWGRAGKEKVRALVASLGLS